MPVSGVNGSSGRRVSGGEGSSPVRVTGGESGASVVTTPRRVTSTEFSRPTPPTTTTPRRVTGGEGSAPAPTRRRNDIDNNPVTAWTRLNNAWLRFWTGGLLGRD